MLHWNWKNSKFNKNIFNRSHIRKSSKTSIRPGQISTESYWSAGSLVLWDNLLHVLYFHVIFVVQYITLDSQYYWSVVQIHMINHLNGCYPWHRNLLRGGSPPSYVTELTNVPPSFFSRKMFLLTCLVGDNIYFFTNFVRRGKCSFWGGKDVLPDIVWEVAKKCSSWRVGKDVPFDFVWGEGVPFALFEVWNRNFFVLVQGDSVTRKVVMAFIKWGVALGLSNESRTLFTFLWSSFKEQWFVKCRPY